ncbi:MAG: hypothetical protein LBQ74_12955 [Prevotella sp.]|jgi:hypothetical protein|nr:hypothetical protein [Prevotella sp.]
MNKLAIILLITLFASCSSDDDSNTIHKWEHKNSFILLDPDNNIIYNSDENYYYMDWTEKEASDFINMPIAERILGVEKREILSDKINNNKNIKHRIIEIKMFDINWPSIVNPTLPYIYHKQDIILTRLD